MGIVRRIRAAGDCDTLRRLHQRARAFLLEQLGSTVSVDWLARYARLLNESIGGRVLHLAGAEEQGACWCFYGAAGRGEALTPVAPQMAMIAAGRSRASGGAASASVSGDAGAMRVRAAAGKGRRGDCVRDAGGVGGAIRRVDRGSGAERDFAGAAVLRPAARVG